MSLPSIMEHRFSQIPQQPLQRSSFDRSKGHKTTMDAGFLIPVFLDEILPGDTVSMDATFFARIATMLYVPMDNIYFDTFWFFVPNRLVWDNWQKFNGERLNPTDSIDYEIPVLSVTDSPYEFDAFSLYDYLGLPVGVPMVAAPGPSVISALPLRGYNLIYNEWFRDQNIQNSVTVNTGDGPDLADGYVPLRRGKRHDYFTSCLPWPQKGDAVALPLGTLAPVVGDGSAVGFDDGTGNRYLSYDDRSGINAQLGVSGTGGSAGGAPAGTYPTGDRYLGLAEQIDDGIPRSHMYADLSQATAATILQLREAFAIQQLLELDARGGTRYVEQLRAMWGVQVPDFRLQRPEYLGGSSQRLDIRQVAQTTPTSEGEPKASLASYGQVVSKSGFHHSFVEHGYLFCLANVRADITYQQGMDRHWTRSNRYDFYMPPFAHLGEQPVYQRELFWDITPGANETVFGYQERWAEYRYSRSFVTGAFRSGFAASLEAWHLALDFGSAPQLDSSFIEDDPPIDRIRAIQPPAPDGQQFLVDMYFGTRWARLMPVYSVPGLMRL